MLDKDDIEMLQEMFESTIKESVDAAVKKSVDAAVKKSVDVAVKESVDVAVRESVDAAVKKSVDVAVKESVDVAVKESVDAAVKENVDIAVKKSMETTVEAIVQKAIEPLRRDICDLKERTSSLETEVKGVKLHLENVTDRNISILAENHGYLIKKLNESIDAAHNNHVNTVQTSYLIERVANLENRMQAVEKKMAL